MKRWQNRVQVRRGARREIMARLLLEEKLEIGASSVIFANARKATGSTLLRSRGQVRLLSRFRPKAVHSFVEDPGLIRYRFSILSAEVNGEELTAASVMYIEWASSHAENDCTLRSE